MLCFEKSDIDALYELTLPRAMYIPRRHTDSIVATSFIVDRQVLPIPDTEPFPRSMISNIDERKFNETLRPRGQSTIAYINEISSDGNLQPPDPGPIIKVEKFPSDTELRPYAYSKARVIMKLWAKYLEEVNEVTNELVCLRQERSDLREQAFLDHPLSLAALRSIYERCLIIREVERKWGLEKERLKRLDVEFTAGGAAGVWLGSRFHIQRDDIGADCYT